MEAFRPFNQVRISVPANRNGSKRSYNFASADNNSIGVFFETADNYKGF